MIKVTEIPNNYEIKRWGHLGNQESWWNSSQQAYLERRLLMKYNNIRDPGAFLVYHDVDGDMYTILEHAQ